MGYLICRVSMGYLILDGIAFGQWGFQVELRRRPELRIDPAVSGSEMFREHVCTWPNDIVLVSRWNNLETRSTNVLLSIMLPSASASAVGSPFCLGHFCISNKFLKVMFKILRHLPSGKRKNSLQTGKPPFFGVNQLFRLGHFQ